MGKPDSSYEKRVKKARANRGDISCSRCPYHRSENNGHGRFAKRPDRYKNKRRR
ncbi:MAG: hypothetical protein KAR06_11050 [Deltaproteobacteria bacterium]|nr:hypothetical protein [Deltaproteobacteria bacterium]